MNLNALVMIQKNWPCDACDDFTFKEDVVKEYFVDEVDLLDAHEIELVEASYFEDDVDESNVM